VAIHLAVLLAHPEARAEACDPPTPTCHLESGKQLLKTHPKRAAAALLESYKLDERTDTLVLYATALELDRRYALAVETWKRIVVYRESELTAAKEAARRAPESKGVAARAAVTRARKRTEQAAQAIIKLSPSVAVVRIRFAAGPKPTVSRDGVEVDASHEVVVNAGRDELVFTRTDGSVERRELALAAGDNVRIDAPDSVARPVPQQPKLEATKPTELETPTRPTEAQPEPEDAARPLEPALATSPLAEEPRSRTMSRVGLTLVVGAVAVGGIAGTLGYLSSRDFDRARDAGCSADGECLLGPAVDLAERSNDRARLARISALGAGALLATGVTLWVVGRSRTRSATTDVTLRLAPSSATVAWRF